jgi:MFS family permease
MQSGAALTLQRFLFGAETPSTTERTTLPRFLFGMIFQGIWWAGYLLVPFVLAKSLAAPAGLITLAVAMDTSGMLLALYWGHLLARGLGPRITLWGGIAGRLILLLSFFTTTAASFMALLAVVYFFAALVYPAQNGILQANFRPRLQGRIWGLGTSIQNFMAVGTSLVVGKILDHDPNLYRAVYAVIGCCGFVYLLVLSRLPFVAAAFSPAGSAPTTLNPGPGTAQLPPPLPAWDLFRPGRLLRGLVRPFTEAVTIFQRDRGYLWYEINFTVYGLAFLMIYAMLPILLAGHLGLTYGQISTARIVIAQAGVAMLAPLMGRFSDRHHPARLCQLAFGIMALFPVGLIIAHNTPTDRPELLIYAVFGVYAVGMSGVNIGWNVGSISFAPPGEGSRYQGIHVALVGVRGLLGPAFGLLIYRLFGIDRVFMIACFLLLLSSFSAGALSGWLQKVRTRDPSLVDDR